MADYAVTKVEQVHRLAAEDAVVKSDTTRAWPITFFVIIAGAIVITSAWIALFGYGVWLLLDWIVG